MKLPLSMIQQFLPVELSIKDLSEKMTLLGIEVESVENAEPNFSNVIVAEVKEVCDHPDAKKLVIATVFDGKKDHQVVCGASNCRKGIKTAFAQPGAILNKNTDSPFEIKKAKLRNVDSFGMLCALDELIGGTKQEGIVEFSDEITIGKDVSELLWDPVFDLALTPNLGHCLSALGVARELCSLLNVQYKKSSHKVLGTHTESISAQVISKEACPTYLLRVVKDVHVGPSPFWLKNKLQMCGIKSINNIVDITNYVMLELGQPMHAFDLKEIDGSLHIAKNTSETTLLCLDEQSRKIPKGMLLIQDDEKPLAIAGVIGGKESSITQTTQDIVFEAAIFSPMEVRKSSKEAGVRTESSSRFEKGVDPSMTQLALQRATELVQALAKGKPSKVVTEKVAVPSSPRITCRLSRIETLLGTKFSQNEIINLLQQLNCEVKVSKEDSLQITPPSYRYDLNLEVDIIEEIARIYGYQNLTRHLPRYVGSKMEHDPFYLFEKSIKQFLVGQGLQECIHCDLISPEMASNIQEFHRKDLHCIQVLHAKSSEYSILRPSLLPGFLQTLRYNQGRDNTSIAAFEIGRIALQKDQDFVQEPMIGIAMMGNKSSSHWDRQIESFDFFDLKGLIENLKTEFQIASLQFETSANPSFHPYRQTALHLKDCEVGVMGQLHPSLLHKMEIEHPVFYAEMNLHTLFNAHKPKKTMQPLPMYPGSTRDWTATLKMDMPIAQIHESIQTFPSHFLEKVELIDLYTSDNLGKDKKNATFRFSYRDRTKTISLEEVEKEHQKILVHIQNQLKELIIS